MAVSAAPLSARTQTAAPAAPALWIVQDEDSPLYLFGTIHFVKPDEAWRSEPVDAAFATSSRLILELAVP